MVGDKLQINIETLDDYGFLFCYIGGVLVVVLAILGLIINLSAPQTIGWFLSGGGYLVLANEIAGAVVSIVLGILAILLGLKLFWQKAWDIITKMDLIFSSLIMIVIGVITMSLGGIIVLVSGILVLIYRLLPEGKTNPKGL